MMTKPTDLIDIAKEAGFYLYDKTICFDHYQDKNPTTMTTKLLIIFI